MHSIPCLSFYHSLSHSLRHIIILSAYVNLCLYLLIIHTHVLLSICTIFLQSLVLSLSLHLTPSIAPSSSLLISTSVYIFLIIHTHVLLSICTIFLQSLVLSLSLHLTPSIAPSSSLLISTSVYIFLIIHTHVLLSICTLFLQSLVLSLSLHLTPSITPSSSLLISTSVYIFLILHSHVLLSICTLFPSSLSFYHSFSISLPQYLCLSPPPPSPPMPSWSFTLTSYFLGTRNKNFRNMSFLLNIDKDIPRSKFRGYTHIIPKVR